MNAGSTWLVRKTPSLWQAVALLLFSGTIATASIAQDSTYGTLVLQSPVQAVAAINGEGAFLLVPGQDLRWSRIRPGSYRVDVRSGGQQWQRDVQVQPGQTETLVAALSSAGSPLGTGALPPPPPVAGAIPAYVPPPPSSAIPAATLSPPPVTATQQRKEELEEQEAQRRREQELRQQQREDRVAQQREREAVARVLREEQQRERERQEEEGKSQRRRRPKVH